MKLDLTLFSYIMAVVVSYYSALFLAGAKGVRTPDTTPENRPLIVVVIPAHNEEVVIRHTLDEIRSAHYTGSLRMLVIDDASTDRTGEIVDTWALLDPRLRTLHRGADTGGRGKSEALNHAYAQLAKWHAEDDIWLERRPLASIVFCIVDADGKLSPTALDDATAFFRSRSVGAVQIGVQIRNASHGLLTRMQDIEFVGF